MERKKRDRTPNYLSDSSPNAAKLARFRQQMADFARGERLRRLREARHLSQEDAAHEIGVSVKTIRSWEHGGGIKWKNAQTAGRFYEVDAESLVTRELPESAGPVDGDASTLDAHLDRIESKVDELLRNWDARWALLEADETDQETSRSEPQSVPGSSSRDRSRTGRG